MNLNFTTHHPRSSTAIGSKVTGGNATSGNMSKSATLVPTSGAKITLNSQSFKVGSGDKDTLAGTRTFASSIRKPATPQAYAFLPREGMRSPERFARECDAADRLDELLESEATPLTGAEKALFENETLYKEMVIKNSECFFKKVSYAAPRQVKQVNQQSNNIAQTMTKDVAK